jgi:hypothetical protein
MAQEPSLCLVIGFCGGLLTALPQHLMRTILAFFLYVYTITPEVFSSREEYRLEHAIVVGCLGPRTLL